jgi:Transposase DDE domain group 1
VHRVTLDLDPTDNPTHGGQQLSFFNGHYDTWCYGMGGAMGGTEMLGSVTGI